MTAWVVTIKVWDAESKITAVTQYQFNSPVPAIKVTSKVREELRLIADEAKQRVQAVLERFEAAQ